MSMSKKWSTQNIPDLSGKTVIVTGGNRGLGYLSALELANKNARVVIACRDVSSGLAAKDKILQAISGAKVSVLALDLGDQDSIERFCLQFIQEFQRLDILLCNAGVVNLANHQLTKAGHEMHMAINHYGHFALTGRLLPLIVSAANARIVVVTSLAHKQGRLDFDDINWLQRPYSAVKSYGDSKLANLLFVEQLNRLLKDQGSSAIALAAHPGLTGTERQQTIGIGGVVAKWLASPTSKGVLPQLLSSTGTEVKAGEFFGPRYGLFGAPVKITQASFDPLLGKKLWQLSERVTGVSYSKQLGVS